MAALAMAIFGVVSDQGSKTRSPRRTGGTSASVESGVVSVSTIPSRLRNVWIQENLLRMVAALPPQLRMILNVPYVSLGGEAYAVPASLRDVPRLHIHRCTDLGPITKVIPTLQSADVGPDEVVIVIDDDTSYFPHVFEDLFEAVRAVPGAVHALCDDRITGYQGFAFVKKKLVGLTLLTHPPECLWVDDDILDYFVKVHRRLPVHVVNRRGGVEPEAIRTCSFDRTLTYSRPRGAWPELSSDASRNAKTEACKSTLRQQWAANSYLRGEL
jgi:hypothetical protein